jgi:hypothetical protein
MQEGSSLAGGKDNHAFGYCSLKFFFVVKKKYISADSKPTYFLWDKKQGI